MKLGLRRRKAAPRQRDKLPSEPRALFGQTKGQPARGANPKLYQAAFDGRVEDVKALIAQGVDLDERGFGGKTALMMAAGSVHSSVSGQELADLLDRRTEIAKLLIDGGADPRLKSTVGDTALAIAERESHDDIASMLRVGAK